MDLLHLVDRLEELVASAQKMPIGSRAIVDRRRLLDIVDQMRIAVPREVREAQDMMVRREMLEREAEEEARMIIARAEQDAARLAEDHAITEAARRRAEEIVASAELRLQERIDEANREIQDRLWESRGLAEQQMAAADAYAKELLERLERQLQAFVRSVRAGIEQLDESQPDESTRASAEFQQAIDEQRGTSGATGPIVDFGTSESETTESGGWNARSSGDFIPPSSRSYEGSGRNAGTEPETRVHEDEAPVSPIRLDHGETRDRGYSSGSMGSNDLPQDVTDEESPIAEDEAQPVPLRARIGSRETLDLDNLLYRSEQRRIPQALHEEPGPSAPAGPGVIDDFDLPGLDDDPTQRGGPQGR